MFEPMFQQELEAQCEVKAIEERMLNGVPTKVYAIQTLLTSVGMTSVAYYTESGDLLEDRIANGLITMRIEPENVARDVQYENDTIVSNAAMVNRRITDARERPSLKLRIRGPIEPEHRFDDGGQQFTPDGDAYLFEGRRFVPRGPLAKLPIADPAVTQWIQPTTFVQSDHPRIVAKAREIAGDEQDALKAVERLVTWVSDNMEPAFSARLTNALEVLDSLEGDCTEHSILFIALARAAGVPAREAAGLIYADYPEPGFYFHQWATVWVGEWMDVDPTFGQVYADATHIKLSEGDLLEQVKFLPVIGQLSIEVIGD
jgi:transglutaminase-like putative cysteine protease